VGNWEVLMGSLVMVLLWTFGLCSFSGLVGLCQRLLAVWTAGHVGASGVRWGASGSSCANDVATPCSWLVSLLVILCLRCPPFAVHPGVCLKWPYQSLLCLVGIGLLQLAFCSVVVGVLGSTRVVDSALQGDGCLGISTVPYPSSHEMWVAGAQELVALCGCVRFGQHFGMSHVGKSLEFLQDSGMICTQLVSSLQLWRQGCLGVSLAVRTCGWHLVFTFLTLSVLFCLCCGQSVYAQMLHGVLGDQFWTSPSSLMRAKRVRSRFGCCIALRWLPLLLFLGGFRVGEASHPGPESADSVWSLGVANPSGLNGKLDQINHMHGQAWILSETQLSRQGLSGFVKGLKMLRSPWKYVVAGAPCQPRHGTDTGSHSGVMFLSKYPARALPHTFDADAYVSGRLQVVGMAVHDVWVTAGLLYGMPMNANHKQARYQTDALLAELVDRVGLNATGPRVIGGDFNFGPDELPQLARLHDLGFREVQDLSAWRFGISAQATGRGAKRIDQLWISPELQLVYRGVSVDFTCWADHAAISAQFSISGLSPQVLHWPMPAPFPWPSDWTCCVAFDPESDLTLEYAKLWAQVETQAKLWNQHHGCFVAKSQCGRASVLDTKVKHGHHCPLKKARVGDIQPQYLGVSLQHARYFKQLRRLQSLCRVLAKGVSTESGQVNRDETWRAIRCAAGFPGGFGLWCVDHGLLPGAGSYLPLTCPHLDVVQALFDGFQTFVRCYEQELARQRYQHARTRRANNLAYVFQDCKDDPLPKADVLLDRVEISVEEVREEDSSVVLTGPTTLLDGVPVVIQGSVVDVVAHSEDQLWVESVEGLRAGDVLTQERPVTSDVAILQRFAEAWEPRWNKASHVLPGQWDQICGFLERVLRPMAWPCAGWTTEGFAQAVKSKKTRAAKGPDGVSQPDLVALPLGACSALVSLYNAVEAGSPWPAQLANGFVSSLAKRPDAQQVDEFRPVVVYSLLYRVWSSERARESLKALAPVLPHSVQGGVPCRQAKTIWYELATALEQAYLQGTGLHGLLMDIQKAFNNLPRLPLWRALSLLDFPKGPLTAWQNFVARQTRRFKIRRSVGAPLVSNCGLPEGCAFSVFGMVVVDWILDLWLSALDVGISLRTFVDDWGLLFQDASIFDRAWTAIEAFTDQMDLALDLGKTRLWSTEATARKQFREGHIPVTLSARNLGAHHNFSRHCHNAELQKRLARLPPVWVRLRASHGPYRYKVAAIHMMAWPRALHGISVVHLGACHYKVLRAGALRGLKADRKGANPFLHLATSSLESDPEAWATLQTLRDARDQSCPARTEALLGLFSQIADVPANGPTAVLLSRIRRLGWAVGGQGLLQDRFGTFSLFSVSWDELQLRLRLAWGAVLASEVAHRPTFGGLENADLPELHRMLRQFGPADQVYLRCHLDGTLFTQNARAKFEPGTSAKCPWCDQTDGFHHRAWICAHFAPCRAHFTPAQLAVVASLPPCLRDHGWPVVLPEWEVYIRQLLRDDGLCRMSPTVPPAPSGDVLELFLDGTGACPEEPKLRFAAWAVTLATGGVGTLDNMILMGGHVTGMCQTPFRAELMAAYYAIRWAVQRQQQVRLWIDCQGVVKGLRRVLQRLPLKRNRPHSDLWAGIVALLGDTGHQLIQVRKGFSGHGAIGRMGLLAQQFDRPSSRWDQQSQITRVLASVGWIGSSLGVSSWPS